MLEKIAELIVEFMHEVKFTVSLLFISVTAGLTRSLVKPDERNFQGYLISMLAAVAVGYFTSLGMREADIGQGVRDVCVAIAAFNARYVLLWVSWLGESLSKDPMLPFKLLLRKKK